MQSFANAAENRYDSKNDDSRVLLETNDIEELKKASVTDRVSRLQQFII